MKNKKHYTMEDIIRMDAKISIRKAFKRYGIEGTEDAIKRVYKFHPKSINCMLSCYYEMLAEYLIKGYWTLP